MLHIVIRLICGELFIVANPKFKEMILTMLLASHGDAKYGEDQAPKPNAPEI